MKMFGMEQMIKSMLEDMGIDIEQVKAEALTAYQDGRAFMERMVGTQAQIVQLMKINHALQVNNAMKLDAIMSHLQISFNSEENNGPQPEQLRIDGPAKPN
jgi:hypothetical protein